MDFLRTGYDDAVRMLEEQKADIHKLLAIMIENDVPVPQNIAKKIYTDCHGRRTTI